MSRKFIIPSDLRKPGKTPDAVRQQATKERLILKGGNRQAINLRGHSMDDLLVIKARDGYSTNTAAIAAALHFFARVGATNDDA